MIRRGASSVRWETAGQALDADLGTRKTPGGREPSPAKLSHPDFSAAEWFHLIEYIGQYQRAARHEGSDEMDDPADVGQWKNHRKAVPFRDA